MLTPLIIVAAGGLAREVVAAIGTTREIAGFLDDNLGDAASYSGIKVRGAIETAALYLDCQFLVCAGAGEVRSRLVNRLREVGVRENAFATFVDRSIRVPQSCRIGRGSILLPGVVLTADVTIGRHVVAMPNAVFTHDTVLDDFTTVCAGVVLGGGVQVGRAAYIGMNASIRQKCKIGTGATLGMGSTLLTDLPAHAVWAGVPARPIGGIDNV